MSLAGYWRLEDNADNTAIADASGNGYSGTAARNTSLTTAAGLTGSCYGPNGSTDFITLGSSVSALSFIQNTLIFSIAAWIKLASLTTRQVIVGNAGSTSSRGFLFLWEYVDASIGRKALRLACYNGVSGATEIDGHSNNEATITDTNWHHVAVVGGGLSDSLTFYVDGVAKTTTYNAHYSGTPSSGNSSVATRLCTFNATPSLPFGGLLADVRIYNHALSVSQIAEIYNGGSATRRSILGSLMAQHRQRRL